MTPIDWFTVTSLCWLPILIGIAGSWGLARLLAFKYEPPKYSDGDRVDFDWRRNDYRFICCDCDSVHILRFFVAGDKIRMRVFRGD